MIIAFSLFLISPVQVSKPERNSWGCVRQTRTHRGALRVLAQSVLHVYNERIFFLLEQNFQLFKYEYFLVILLASSIYCLFFSSNREIQKAPKNRNSKIGNWENEIATWSMPEQSALAPMDAMGPHPFFIFFNASCPTQRHMMVQKTDPACLPSHTELVP